MAITIPGMTPAEGEVHTPAMFHCAADAPKSPELRGGPIAHSAVHERTHLPGRAARRSGVRNRFVKVRLSPAEYAAVARHADLASMAMSEYMRGKVLAVHQTLDIQAELRALRELLANPAPAAPAKSDPALTEVALLLREYIGSRDAQAIARVRAKMLKGVA
jgi:Mobilization protein NikA